MTDSKFNEKLIRMGQGPAILATEAELSKDEIGYTHPNLHRRINTPPDGSISHKYQLSIQGVNSYRTTEIITHDEESTTSEIP